MSDDIETVHENVNGDQTTTKRVAYEGEVYEFEGEPGGEYAGEGDAPAGAVQALQEHLGEDATVAGAAKAKYSTESSNGKNSGESE